jgi:hypothetical protein
MAEAECVFGGLSLYIEKAMLSTFVAASVDPRGRFAPSPAYCLQGTAGLRVLQTRIFQHRAVAHLSDDPLF